MTTDLITRARAGDSDAWLEPYPDALLEGSINVPLGPEARYARTEAISPWPS